MAKQQNSNYYVPFPQQQQGRASYAMPAEGAVVYGDSPAMLNLPQNLNYINQVNYMRQAEQDAHAQQLAQSWRDNELAASEGQLWSNQIGGIERDHIEKGQRLVQQGVDPYTSLRPEAVEYRRERRNIENMRSYRKGIESQYNNIIKNIQANPNKYDPRSIQALQDFVSGADFQQLYSSNAQLPGISERFDPSSALSGFKAVTGQTVRTEGGQKITRTEIDQDMTRQGILARLASSPGGQQYIAEMSGGYPPVLLMELPDNLEGATKFFKDAYAGDPELRAQLASQGITDANSAEFNRAIDGIARQTLNAKRSWDRTMDGFVSQAASGISLKDESVRDTTEEDLAIRRANLELSRQREARLREADKDSGGGYYLGDVSVPIGGGFSDGNRVPQGTVTARNGIGLHNSSVNITGGGAYNIRGRQPHRDTPSISGQIVNFGEYPFDDNGNLLDDTQVVNHPNVEYRKMAHVKEGTGTNAVDLLVPAENIPVNSLPKNRQGIVREFMKDKPQSQQGGPGSPNVRASEQTLNLFR